MSLEVCVDLFTLLWHIEARRPLLTRHTIALVGKCVISTELTTVSVFAVVSAEQKVGGRDNLLKKPSNNCKSGWKPVSIPQPFSHDRIEQVRKCSRAKSQPTLFIIWNKESFMEHWFSVQGQSDKHIDFATRKVADISAPTFHYGIIWFSSNLSSVPSFHSGIP